MPRFPLSAAPQSSPPSARRPGPSGKIWFFRAFTALVIPALLLLLLEGGLRVTGFGRPTGFFISDDKPWVTVSVWH